MNGSSIEVAGFSRNCSALTITCTVKKKSVKF